MGRFPLRLGWSDGYRGNVCLCGSAAVKGQQSGDGQADAGCGSIRQLFVEQRYCPDGTHCVLRSVDHIGSTDCQKSHGVSDGKEPDGIECSGNRDCRPVFGTGGGDFRDWQQQQAAGHQYQEARRTEEEQSGSNRHVGSDGFADVNAGDAVAQPGDDRQKDSDSNARASDRIECGWQCTGFCLWDVFSDSGRADRGRFS